MTTLPTRNPDLCPRAGARSTQPRRAAFFDMDGTLIRVNSGSLYARWRFRRREAGLRDMARVARWMALYSLGAIDAEAVSRRALESVAGRAEDEFRSELAEWYAKSIRPHVTAHARAEVERRTAAGDLVVILSASTPYIVQPLASDLGIEHTLCSILEVAEGRFTGRCVELCYGASKVRFAERWAADHGIDLDQSSFYTDSVSDVPMLRRVRDKRVINPDPRLARLARREGWPVDRWL